LRRHAEMAFSMMLAKGLAAAGLRFEPADGHYATGFRGITELIA